MVKHAEEGLLGQIWAHAPMHPYVPFADIQTPQVEDKLKTSRRPLAGSRCHSAQGFRAKGAKMCKGGITAQFIPMLPGPSIL